jgi:hypothetical protein
VPIPRPMGDTRDLHPQLPGAQTMSETLIPLSNVPRHLAAFESSRPSYTAVYRAVLNGTIPAEQTRGRWLISSANLDTVAAISA